MWRTFSRIALELNIFVMRTFTHHFFYPRAIGKWIDRIM